MSLMGVRFPKGEATPTQCGMREECDRIGLGGGAIALSLMGARSHYCYIDRLNLLPEDSWWQRGYGLSLTWIFMAKLTPNF